MPDKLKLQFFVLSLMLVSILAATVLPREQAQAGAYPANPNLALTPTPVSYYIDPVNGKDSAPNDGKSLGAAFRTVQKAANLTNPGDTVYLLNGTYTDQNGGILSIQRSGTAESYITYKNYPGHTPRLHATNSWNIIKIDGAAYIRIEGLDISGDSANITYDYAYSQKDIANPRTNTNCIGITTDYATGTKIPHHIEVRNNRVYNCPGGGIVTQISDYVTIENNLVYSTSWWTRYATSGISLLTSVDIDDYSGYKNFVQNNIVYDNQTFIPWEQTKAISDGNGIIIDTNKNSLSDNGKPDYKGRTLVQNNLSYNNGGSGIHSFKSSHVDIINNTAYQNSRSPALDYANIYAAYSSDVNVLNNISYARTGKHTNSIYQNTLVTYNYNIYYNGIKPEVQGSQDLIADPVFVNSATGDFRLQPSSPAINSGTATLAPSSDLKAVPRPIGAGFDRGAFEFVTPPSLTQTLSPAVFIPGGVTTLTFTLANAMPLSLSNVAFSETFPNQVVIANPATLTNTCGGSPNITSNSGSNSFVLTGLALSPNQTCAISVKITSNTIGTYSFTADPIISDQTPAVNTSNTLSLEVGVPVFQATPIFAGNTFRVGAVKAGNSKTESLRLANVGIPVVPLNISYPVLSGADANRFAIVSPSGDFPLALTGGTSYNLNISCSPITTGALSANLNFTTSGPGISSVNQTIKVSCSGAYAVTKAQDDGTVGTLSYALKNVTTHPGDGVVFELGGATSINLATGALLPLLVQPGVTIDAGCSSRLSLVGNGGAISQFGLAGNDYIVGLILQDIRMSANTAGNQVRCTKVNLLP